MYVTHMDIRIAKYLIGLIHITNCKNNDGTCELGDKCAPNRQVLLELQKDTHTLQENNSTYLESEHIVYMLSKKLIDHYNSCDNTNCTICIPVRMNISGLSCIPFHKKMGTDTEQFTKTPNTRITVQNKKCNLDELKKMFKKCFLNQMLLKFINKSSFLEYIIENGTNFDEMYRIYVNWTLKNNENNKLTKEELTEAIQKSEYFIIEPNLKLYETNVFINPKQVQEEDIEEGKVIKILNELKNK